tara:strand:+ start:589 stop:2220 length:1632 start_codon:yes stop_codon:yes gene_type:complete
LVKRNYSKMRLELLAIIFFLFLGLNQISAQQTNLPLGQNFNRIFDKEISNHIDHSSFKPLIITSTNLNFDSILDIEFSADNNLLKHAFFNNHFILIKGDGYKIVGSPLLNLSLGYEQEDELNTFTNTRGFIIDGHIGSKVSFHTSFVENQSIFPNYIDSMIRTPTNDYVIPGQGRGRSYKESGFDYAKSSGYLSFQASKNFTLQFGHGKHFIGHGYRSLLLSDNAFNYPFLRLQTSFGKFRYTNLYAEFQDMKNYLSAENSYDYMGYAKKYMSSHYLSYQLNEKFNIGIYETIVWKSNHSLGANGFDINYLNPIIFFRPVEYSINSPDNAIIGLDLKYNLTSNSNLYAQVILDEFTLKQIKANNGYWANKYGYQIGYKYYDFLSISNLTLQLERNHVRPYTYSHWNNANYGHYNEELAHPLGANFSENILMLHYRQGRLEMQFKYLDITYGADYLGDTISYGNNVYSDYNNRSSDFGIDMFNGNKTNIDYMQLNFGYIINPSTNLKIDFSLVSRSLSSDVHEYNTLFYSIALKSDLFNHYYDF